MPRLLGIRFEGIGHRDARLDGLVLRVADGGGEPCDSVLWLRNGGGKSSILNLVFSVLRPDQRDFLGAEAEARVRDLLDYVSPDEIGVVCLEWRLDGDDKAPRRLFTGVCVEHRAGHAQPLNRLFYAVRVDPESKLTLEDVPVFDLSTGRKRMFRPAALRERLIGFNDVPGVSAVVTAVQREWEQHLESFGIDPEVFGYQLKMNRREGAADELFRFTSSEEFVDFFLDMVLQADVANRVSDALRDLRAKLQRRPVLEAEHAALGRAADELRPVVRLAIELADARHALQTQLTGLLHLRRDIDSGAHTRRALEAEKRAESASQNDRYNEAAWRRNRGGWRVRVLEYRRRALEADAGRHRLAEAEREQARCERDKVVLDLAAMAEAVERDEARLKELNADLLRQATELAPLRAELGSAASGFARALDGELELRVTRKVLAEGRRQSLEAKLQENRDTQATEHQALGEKRGNRARVVGDWEELERQRLSLVEAGILGASDSGIEAG